MKIKKKTRNRLIVGIGCLLIVVLIIFGIRALFNRSDSQATSTEDVQILEDAGLSDADIKEMTSLSNYRSERVNRYATWKADSIEDVVMEVNCDMDLEPYESKTIVKDDSDMTLLVNKFYAFEDGYVPDDLVDVEEYACVQGEDYSCQDVDQIQMRKEAYNAFLKFCNAAKKEDINIVAIAGYRSYEYQENLWSYAKETNGQDYADSYYARPGQSEHNSGLAVDISFNGYNFNEIENYDGYEWILEHMHEYGFILRYPEDKEDVTRYSYESWHLRYVGVEAATKMYKNNWTLEEYHGAQAE